MAMKPGNGGTAGGERDPRVDGLYRDTPRDLPPAHLDAAILAAARREVGSRPRPLSTQLRRWRLPVSIAAVVVLSVTLVTLVGEESRDPLMSELRSTVEPPVARTVEPQQVEPGVPAKLAEDSQRAPAERYMARRDEAAAKAPMERGKREQEAAPGPGVALGDRRAATAPEAFSFGRDERTTKAPAETQSVAEQDRGRSSAGPATAPETVSPPVAAAAQRPGADVAKLQSSTTTIGIRGSSGDAAPPAAASKPKPMSESAYSEYSRMVSRVPVWQGLEQEPPQKWAERLAELRKQGRTGEADELLAEFKRRFPSHPLPKGQE